MTHWSEDPDEKIVRAAISVALVIGLAGFVLILIAAAIHLVGGF